MTAIDELTNLHNPLQRRPRVEMFSGKEGAKLALLKTLQSKTKTLYAFTSLFDLADRLGEDFIADYTKKRVKSKRRLKILRTRKAYKKALHSRSPKHAYDTDAKELREVKYISDELDFSLGMYLFDQSVVILSSKEENYALVIESNDLSRLLKGMFELLWNILPTETMPTKRSGTR